MNNRFSKITAQQVSHAPFHQNQNGSIMLIVLMLLVMMSIIGVASINNSVTESFMVRNTTIRKQTLHVLDTAVSDALQNVLDAGYSSPGVDLFLSQEEITPFQTDQLWWVHHTTAWDWTNWYDPNFVGRVLTAANSDAPTALVENRDSAVRVILEDRREWDSAIPNADASPIRYALVGWNDVPDDNLDMTEDKVRRSARIIGEYVSEEFGIMRVVIGVHRIFQT